jgi:tetratricopeptide (TPR) repeat protein
MHLLELVVAVTLLWPQTGTQDVAPATTPVPYRTLVDGYRRISATGIDQVLSAPIPALTAAVDAAVSSTKAWTWEETRGATMLHTDAAVRALRLNDTATAESHLLLARRLLDRTVSISPSQQDFVWRWYVTMPHMATLLGAKATAKQLVEYRKRHSTATFARGVYIDGLELEQRGMRDRERYVASTSPASARVQLQETWFGAASHFEEALKNDPTLYGAALHLGRIRLLEQNRERATPLFRSALASPDPSVAYLAALFLGSLKERDGQLDEAEALYRDAVRRVPFGQAAPLALAQLLSRTGRDSEAREALANLLRPGRVVMEPMWAYGPPSEDPATQIDLLRMEVWK